MFGASSIVVLTLALAPPHAPAGRSPEATGPELIVKEKDYFLHALPSHDAGGARPAPRVALPPGFAPQTTYSLVILHTSTATAEMKILAAGGTTVDDTLARFRNCPRPDVSRTRLAGVAADKERIYVLRWHRPPDKEPSMHLLVFRPDTGEQIHALELKGDRIPREEPKETAKKGPLQLTPGGVTCFGRRFEFEGTRLIKQSKENDP